MAGAEAKERLGETTSDPDERKHAEEVQESEVHRYELSDSAPSLCFSSLEFDYTRSNLASYSI